MHKCIINGNEYWFGSIPKLGLVIYNPNDQKGVNSYNVKMFAVKDKETHLFNKEGVRPIIEKCSEDELKICIDAVRDYEKEIRRRKRTPYAKSRITHCYKCGRTLNQVDFPVCKKCGWIACDCGVCGCDYGLV